MVTAPGAEQYAETESVFWAKMERWDRRIGAVLVYAGAFLLMHIGGWQAAAAGFLVGIGGMFRGMAAQEAARRNDGEATP